MIKRDPKTRHLVPGSGELWVNGQEGHSLAVTHDGGVVVGGQPHTVVLTTVNLVIHVHGKLFEQVVRQLQSTTRIVILLR